MVLGPSSIYGSGSSAKYISSSCLDGEAMPREGEEELVGHRVPWALRDSLDGPVLCSLDFLREGGDLRDEAELGEAPHVAEAK